MHPLQLFSVVALVVSLSPARPALIQRSTTDLLGAAAKLKVAYDDLEKYRQALEYATGVADDLKNKQEPRRPKAFEFKRADDRLDKIRRELRGLNVPPLVDPKSPEYRTDELKKNDAIAWKKAAAKLVAYNRALREQVQAMKVIAARLKELQERSHVVWKAAQRMANALERIHNTPPVQLLFRDMFGLAWLDLETKIIPTLGEIHSDAGSRAKEFRNAGEDRQRLLSHHTSMLQAGARLAGSSLPSDIRD